MPTKGPLPFLQVVQAPAPVAGAEWTLRAPGQGIWRVASLSAVLVTSAAAGNRRVQLVADDATDTWFSTVATVDIAASQTVRIGAYMGAAGAASATLAVTVPLPGDGLILMPGYRLRSLTSGLDVGDLWSAVRAQVTEFPEGPRSEYLPLVFTQIGEMG